MNILITMKDDYYHSQTHTLKDISSLLIKIARLLILKTKHYERWN